MHVFVVIGLEGLSP